MKTIIIIALAIFLAVYIFPLLLGAIVGIVKVIAESLANRKTYHDDDKMNYWEYNAVNFDDDEEIGE